MKARLTKSEEQLLRSLAPQVVGVVTRRYRNFSSAEDAVQEALLAAAMQWPEEGLPDNPKAWLIQVASRRMTDQIRSNIARRERERATAADIEAIVPASDFIESAVQDDTLILFFMCCHPALTPLSAIPLTLRAVGGLTTAEIGRAFFVPEATMAQRITRAKQKIKASKVPFLLPTNEQRDERLHMVLRTLYLIFNEGYASSGGESLQRPDLAAEAIRLTRAIHDLLPDDGEVTGLLALMLLTNARSAARTGADGELIPLSHQDRRMWNRNEIAEGVALIERTLPKAPPGLYLLQAAIAALHDEAATVEETDWPQILALYDILERLSDNPMVALNRAVAFAMVHGSEAGLELLNTLDKPDRLAGHHRLEAVRAHFLELCGNLVEAIGCYRIAAERTASLPERNYLLTQASRLSELLAGESAASNE